VTEAVRCSLAAQQLAEADPAGWRIGWGAWPASLRDNRWEVCPLPPGSLARGRWAANFDNKSNPRDILPESEGIDV